MRATICLVALFLQIGYGSAAQVKFKSTGNPVEDVIGLLEDLETQTKDEGSAEATTYDKFACFCKDTTDEKSTAILDDKTEIEKQKGELVEQTTLKAKLQQDIKDLNQKIADLNAEMSESQAVRDAAKTKFESIAADMHKAVESIEGAKDTVLANKAASFVQVKTQIKEKIRESLAHAKMDFDPKFARQIEVLLQVDGDEDEGVPEGDFESHTGDLEEMMNGLEDKYTDKEEVNQEDEDKAVKEHEDYMVAMTETKEATEEELDKTTEKLNKAEEAIGNAMKALTEAKEKLDDDEAYLKDLTAKCELKAREWDQRSQMRADELAALAKALGIIKDTVLEKDAANEATRGSFVQKVDAPVKKEAKKAAVDADEDADDDDDDDVSFLQKSPNQKVGSLLRKAVETLRGKKSAHKHAVKVHMSAREHHQYVRDKVIDLLRDKGQALKSPALISMAMKVSADPFVKVKALINDLIAKLIEEAADESTQKGWCDMSIGKAKNERDYEYVETAKLHANVEKLEATRDELAENVDTLTTEISELNDSLAKMTENRDSEKSENMQTLQTANEGRDAVMEAIGVLEAFYKGAAKGAVSLLQQKGVDDDAPSTTSATAYQGNQGAAGGILGQLNVIKGDFDKTIKVTTDNEYSAARAFAEFSTETKGSISGKETEKGQKEADHKNTVNEIDLTLEDMSKHQSLLDDTLKELASLKPACIDTGDSYEDRVKKREDEIAALKSAICILDSDGAEDKC